jgi:alkylation response protein AidB-like acyl-CoA dehydrogenase
MNTSAKQLLANARDIAPTLTAEAPKSEKSGRLTDTTVAALRDGGMFGLMVPKTLGGAEASPTEALEVIEALAYADGSAGWVTMAMGVCTGMAAGYLGEAGAKDIFNGRIPVICGQGATNGRAVVEGNGYRLTGKWSYGSGALHSDYLHSGAIVYENGAPKMKPNGEPLILTTLVPTREGKMLGNWDVLGLRATGSVDYAIESVFVPADHCHPPDSTDPARGGAFFRMGIIGMTALGHTGFTMGVGRRTLDELAAFARKRPPVRGHLPVLPDLDSFRQDYGDQEAKFRASRAFCMETWRDIEATLERGEKMSTRQITLLRLALNHITTVTADLVTYAYKTAGGMALRDSTLQRCFRDMHAGTQHFLTRSHVLSECGRELAGLAPGQHWTLLGLTDKH